MKRVGDIQFNELNHHDRSVVETALRSGASRREVMGWLLAGGATVMAAGSVVTAASNAIAATPKRGGQIRFGWDLHGPNDTMDPALFTSSIDYARGRLTYSSLTRLQEDLTVAPEVATEWEANDDATEWVFTIRTDIEWHDGSKLTADDVVYSMRRHIGSDSVSKANSLVASVTAWDKVSDNQVKATLSSPNAELPIVLGTFHFKIVKDGTTDFQTAIGSGPFKLKEFAPGVRSVHVRNENYWGDGGPYVDEVEVFGITDNVARTNALISGDVQMIGNLDTKAIGQVEAADGVDVFSVASGAYMNLNFRVDQTPGNNPDFVRAMQLLMRRDRILQVVQKGQGSLGNDHPIGPAYGASHYKELEQRAFDPDMAKSLIAKSGVTKAQVDVAEVGPGLTDICLMLQRECAKIGFNLTVNKVPNDGYWGTVWMKSPLHVVSWNMRPTANIMMTLAYKGDANWNETGWQNERFDKILVEQRGELDPAKSYEMGGELQRLIHEKSGSVIATHRSYIDGVASNIKGLPRVPLATFGGCEWPEYIWIDA